MMNRKPYKIGVFGISRSGKDSTIEVFIDIAKSNGYEFIHMSPIGMIRERMIGVSLKTLSDTEKRELVREVREEIARVAETQNVIVDEHYCFPQNFGGKVLENGYYDEKLPHDIMRINGDLTPYEVVFPRFGTDFYDKVIVMKIDPDLIIERMRGSDGCKRNEVATRDDIIRWQHAETIGTFHDTRGRGITQPADPLANAEGIWDAFMEMVAEEQY